MANFQTHFKTEECKCGHSIPRYRWYTVEMDGIVSPREVEHHLKLDECPECTRDEAIGKEKREIERRTNAILEQEKERKLKELMSGHEPEPEKGVVPVKYFDICNLAWNKDTNSFVQLEQKSTDTQSVSYELLTQSEMDGRQRLAGDKHNKQYDEHAKDPAAKRQKRKPSPDDGKSDEILDGP